MTSHSKKNSNLEDMLAFINDSPCCFQVVENVEKRLLKDGYTELLENERWNPVPGGKYYVNRNGSSLLAFHLPKKEWEGFRMIASHSDSPCFKIKQNPEIAGDGPYVRLNVEKYGGMIMSTWLDRPLSVAGRIIAGTNGEIRSIPVAVEKDLLIIPNVAIHMNRDMNKGVEYNPQIDMLPLYGEADRKDSFMKLIAQESGISEEEILDYDLFLYNREKGRQIGAKGEFICSPRLDDLECVYASLSALLMGKPEKKINLIAVFDNEEVGSLTRQGAASTFLRDTLLRICEAFHLTEGEYIRRLADSFMISADNAHAVHPNHPEKADPSNRPCLNGGIVIKYHGGQKYTTDGISGAIMKEICKKAEVPFQTYLNRSDMAGGSTLGNISAGQVPVRTVDIGLAQLAMHSACETAGSRDVDYLIRALQSFLTDR